MSTAEQSTTANSPDGTFLRARIGSLVAVMPLGVWTVLHLWNNLAAFRGAEAWEESVTHYSHPLAHFATMVVVLLPIVLHTVWGINRLRTTRPNNQRYGFFANFKYLVQRVSALGVLGFLGAHIFKAMIEPRFMHGHPERFADISGQMAHHMPTLVVYLLGTLGVAYHLANGLASFAMGWGIIVSRRSLKKFEWATIGMFLVFLGMSWSIIFAMWKQGQ
jgi:succinate dehydrogenase / fumarate reductase, cytochrome b subunit